MLVFIGILILASYNEASYAGGQKPSEIFLRALKSAPTEYHREALLAKDPTCNYVFDFYNAKVGVVEAKGGRIVTAHAGNFPALVNAGVALGVAHIAPCGLIDPHTHPRATIIAYVIKGEFLTGFYLENGIDYVTETVKEGQAIVIPQAAVHFELNSACTPAVILGAYSTEDPGLLSATAFIQQFPTKIVGAALGGLSENDVKAQVKALPDLPSQNVEKCLRKCGLKT
ncbi:unnamed protein product [Rotaria sp. Silwood1]|nr:unnamed protein product [Rotaria sp. Silwood1]CAF3488367.1 unnamed protein product [Rotaria sp. Silwood1]CAF3703727.1 unnamed protein product [Rotaria sp. Silwood1]CAF4579761.1 unnamed protein product [Rotaria sp. Silwood1]CAF4629175.1 unnamed protein product [Rotaria sp. Silwood1]